MSIASGSTEKVVTLTSPLQFQINDNAQTTILDELLTQSVDIQLAQRKMEGHPVSDCVECYFTRRDR